MSGTITERYTVINIDQWGRLVKSWATHLDYISQDYDKQPPRTDWVNQSWPGEQGRTPGPATVPDHDASGTPAAWCLPPMSPITAQRADGTNVTINAVAIPAADFVSKVTAAGVLIAKMPAQYGSVVIVQGSHDVMVLRLPPKDTLQSSEDDLLNGNPYTVAPFYSDLFGCAPTLPVTDPDIMKLHANRIGEYTLNTCNLISRLITRGVTAPPRGSRRVPCHRAAVAKSPHD